MGYKLMATFLKGKTAVICSFLSIDSGHLLLSTPVNSYWLKNYQLYNYTVTYIWNYLKNFTFNVILSIALCSIT